MTVLDMAPSLNPTPIPRIGSVTALPGNVLELTWRNGRSARVDLTGWIEAPGPEVTLRLRDRVVFNRISVIDGGAAVQWDGDDDLIIDALHLDMLATQQADFTSADLIGWQERHNLDNRTAAAMLDIHVNTLGSYRRNVTKVPRSVAIAIRAMESDPLIFAAHYRPSAGTRAAEH